MKKIPRMILGCTLAAALALTACSRSDSGSSGSMSTNMGGSSSQTGQAGQNAAYRTGLGILTEASDQERAGKIDTIAAAVLLDAEGRDRHPGIRSTVLHDDVCIGAGTYQS